MQVSYVVSGSGNMTIHMNKNVYNIDREHVNYEAIRTALKQKKYNVLDKLINVAKAVEKKMNYVSKNRKVTLRNGQVLYSGEPVHNYLADTIVKFVGEGFDYDRLVNMLVKLMKNPSKKSVDNLYRFLEYNNIVICEDGDFLAYKRVKEDYRDFYTGKMDNSIGKVVKMDRNKVEDDPNITCAAGLHTAALFYARDFYHGGHGRLIVVKVNPENVVSVPTDYNNAKMRTCEYTVVEEFTKEFNQSDFSPHCGHAAVDPDDYDDFDVVEMDEDEDTYEDES